MSHTVISVLINKMIKYKVFLFVTMIFVTITLDSTYFHGRLKIFPHILRERRTLDQNIDYTKQLTKFPSKKNFSTSSTQLESVSAPDVQSLCLDRLGNYNEGHFTNPNVTAIKNEDVKVILAMVGNYGYKHFGFGYGREPFEASCCKEPRCFLTPDRSLLPVENYDAIIFHYRTLLPKDIPKKRSIHQKYILFELEPSSYVYQDPKIYDGVFNWTWNFRSDADITYRYNRVLPQTLLKNAKEKVPENKNYATGKTKLVSWFVSRCSSMSWREKFVEDLQNFITVDVYGSCGLLSCYSKATRFSKCYEMAEKQYKFYLSFENSLCKDYVTEKFFNILNFDMIPIVYGDAEYKRIAPPNSYINILDFKDAEQLSKYLLYLNDNDKAYNKYFRWKKVYFLPSFWGNIALNFCSLCEKLHEPDLGGASYEYLSDYFIDKSECRRIKPLPWWQYLVTKS